MRLLFEAAEQPVLGNVSCSRCVAVQETQSLVAENHRLLASATSERNALVQRLSTAEAGCELAQGDLRSAVAENERLSHDVQRAEDAIDALEAEHRRFVQHATGTCDRKDKQLQVRLACFVRFNSALTLRQRIHDCTDTPPA